jgi:hypothetical protein
MLFSASDNGDAKREHKAILACPWNQRLAVGMFLMTGIRQRQTSVIIPSAVTTLGS